MKIDLVVEDPAGNRNFSTNGWVRGIANIHLPHKTAVSRIVLLLRGRLDVSIAPKWVGAGNWEFVEDEHQVLEISQNLFPAPRVPIASRGYSLSKGNHSYPFEIQFPVLAGCPERHLGMHHVTASLPPSSRLQGPTQGDYANIHYWLEVQVQRPGPLHRDGLLERDITFSPLDPPLPPPMLSPATCNRQGSRIALEAALPSPSILYLGSVVPLKLFVRRLGPVDGLPAINLRSLSISVRAGTSVTVGSHHSAWASNRDIISLPALELPLSEPGHASTEVPSSLWDDVPVADLTPSFTTCTIRHQHSLLVRAAFDYDGSGAVEVLTAVLNVEVHTNISPAPGFDTGFIPWRLGSESHLGIRRGSTLDTTFDPPPYGITG